MHRTCHFDSPMRSYIGRLYGGWGGLPIPIYCYWLSSVSRRCLLCVGVVYFQTKEVIMSWLYARAIRSGAAWKDTLGTVQKHSMRQGTSYPGLHCEGADRTKELALGTPIQPATTAKRLSNWNQAQSPVLIVIDCLPAKSGVIPSNCVPTQGRA